MSIALNPLQVLPEEVSIQIFSYLKQSELATCCQVSKGWRRLASDNILWKEFAKQIFNGEVPNAPIIKTFLQEFESQQLRSNEEIIDYLQAFIDRISLGQNARFRCLINIGPRYQTISVEIKGTKDKITRISNTLSACKDNLTDFSFKNDCIAVNGIGNGSLVTPQPPEYQPKSQSFSKQIGMSEHIITCTIPYNGSFQAVLRFPELPHTDLHHQTNMEHRITNMLQVKLDKFANPVSRKKTIMYTTAAGVVTLGVYFLKLYLTALNSYK